MNKTLHASKFGAVLLACALLFGTAAGCGGQGDVPAADGPPADGDAATGAPSGLPQTEGVAGTGGTAGHEAANGPADAEGDAAPGEAPEAPAGQPADEADPAPAETPKTHYMNKNYFLKPIDEGGDRNVVLLTFDDGPKEEAMLTDMLDTLDRHEAKAVFFVNGFRVKQNPDLLRLIDERGHAIGNHSYDHIVLRDEPEDVIDRQLEDVQALVEETVGKRPRFFRPPNGAGNDYVKEKARELGMLYMTWSNGSLDWADNRNDPEGVIRSVMDQLLPGSIILMHELPWTVEALDALLTQIKAEGFTFLDPEAIEPEMR